MHVCLRSSGRLGSSNTGWFHKAVSVSRARPNVSKLWVIDESMAGRCVTPAHRCDRFWYWIQGCAFTPTPG